MTELTAHKAVEIENPHNAVSDEVSMERRAIVDVSTRAVVVTLFFSGLIWLLFSVSLSFLTALKFQYPEVLNYSFLTFGRISPAADAAFVFGWCSLAATGIAIWINARVSGRVAIGKALAMFGVLIWNLGLALGIISILSGNLGVIKGLEFPGASRVLILVGFCFLATWVFLSSRSFHSKTPLASMFILGGICWFGWALFSGSLLIWSAQFKGALEHMLGAWIYHNIIWMWLIPVSLGSCYYLIPKITGAPIFSGSMGRIGFWGYFLIGGLTSANRLAGGPLPLWVNGVSAAAFVLLLVPVVFTVLNLLKTSRKSSIIFSSPCGRFSIFGLVILVVAVVLNAMSCLKTVDYAVHFTLFSAGLEKLVTHASVSMVFFGAMYYIMPRLSACEWISSSLISIHFLGSAYGVVMAALMWMFGGVFAGFDLSSFDTSFAQVMESNAFVYWGHTFSYVFTGIGFAAFTLHFLLIAVRIGQPEGEPTLLAGPHKH